MRVFLLSISRYLAIIFLFCFATSLQAQSGRCDNELSDGQETQRSFCESHVSCRVVFALFDSCKAAGNFLDGLTKSNNNPTPQQIDDADVTSALEILGVPKPNIKSCTIDFDMTACKQYLGVEQAPIKAPPSTRKLSPAELDYQLSAKLFSEWEDAKLPKGDYSYAKTMLESCAAAKQSTERDKICADAQRKVDTCNTYRQGWLQRRDELIKRVEVSGATGSIKVLPGLEMPPCPYTLPQTFLTPAQALAKWQEEEQGSQISTPLRRELAPETLQQLTTDVNRGVAIHEAEAAKQRAIEQQRLAAEKAAAQRQQDIAASRTLDGRWTGDNGHTVDITTDANGFCATGTGASGRFCYTSVGGQVYRYSSPDGAGSCDMQVESTNYLIYTCTNFRGMIGFRKQGSSPNAGPALRVPRAEASQPAGRTCTASKAWCDCMFSGGSQESCANSW